MWRKRREEKGRVHRRESHPAHPVHPAHPAAKAAEHHLHPRHARPKWTSLCLLILKESNRKRRWERRTCFMSSRVTFRLIKICSRNVTNRIIKNNNLTKK